MSQVPLIAPLECSLMEVHRLKKVEEKVEKKLKKSCKKLRKSWEKLRNELRKSGEKCRLVDLFGQVMSPHHSDQMS